MNTNGNLTTGQRNALINATGGVLSPSVRFVTFKALRDAGLVRVDRSSGTRRHVLTADGQAVRSALIGA